MASGILQTYVPSAPPGKSEDVPSWAHDEFEKVSRALVDFPYLQMEVLHVAPTKPREGMNVIADGTNWNPGQGAGHYTYVGGQWVMGGGVPAGATITVGTTNVSGGVNGQVLYDNAGVLGELTNVQLTSKIQAFTSLLSGAVPASGGNAAFFLCADGTFKSPGSAPVSSVFGRTGAVVAAANDYNFNQLAGTIAGSQIPLPFKAPATTNYTVTTADQFFMISSSAAGGAMTINLPASQPPVGFMVGFINGGHPITLNRGGTSLINLPGVGGVISGTITNTNDTGYIVSDGTNWFALFGTPAAYSGGGTANYLRADGVWAPPPGTSIAPVTIDATGAILAPTTSTATLNPTNTFTESGFVDNSFSRNILRAALPGPHGGQGYTNLMLETRPVGSGANNPSIDSSLGISTIKQSWQTTSVQGEINAAYIGVRQGGVDGGHSDGSGLLVDVANIGTCGSLSLFEGKNSHYNRSLAVDLSFGVQAGITIPGGSSYGFVVTPASPGVLNYGYYIQGAAASLQWPFYYNGGASNNVFSVDSSSNLRSTGSIGYGPTGVGVGGSVTQTGSNANSVTLNKLCGTITGFTAAWSAFAAQAYTVLNSLVAATDVVVVCVKSSTFQAFVAACAAVRNGSFDISIIPAAAVTDSVVVNFLILKGANT